MSSASLRLSVMELAKSLIAVPTDPIMFLIPLTNPVIMSLPICSIWAGSCLSQSIATVIPVTIASFTVVTVDVTASLILVNISEPMLYNLPGNSLNQVMVPFQIFFTVVTVAVTKSDTIFLNPFHADDAVDVIASQVAVRMVLSTVTAPLNTCLIPSQIFPKASLRLFQMACAFLDNSVKLPVTRLMSNSKAPAKIFLMTSHIPVKNNLRPSKIGLIMLTSASNAILAADDNAFHVST
ncbi:hypothetical protein D3C87_1342190 [compost metagenome]